MKKLLLLLFFGAAPLSAQSWERIDLWWQRLDGGTIDGGGGGGGSGTGTVTSVGISVPSQFTLSGSPVTSSGTLVVTQASQTQNTVFAAPDGSDGVPTFRALVEADCPTCSFGGGGGGDVATDAIWDAAGDLVYGTGANTAARLAPGTATQILHGGTTPVWAVVSLTADVSGTLAAGNGGTGITSLASGVATFLGTSTSANLATALTNETGTGVAVFATSPALVTPDLGTPSAVVLTSATGLPMATGITSSTSANLATVLSDEVGTTGGFLRTGGNIKAKSITVENPGAAEKIALFNSSVAGTIVRVRGVLIGSASPSVTYNIKKGSDISAAGTSVTTTPSALTNVTTGANATLDSASITADDWVWFITTAQSGTVTQINVTVEYSTP